MLALICTWLSAAAVAQQAQPASGTAALAARVRELADACVAEFTSRFPEQAVFNSLQLDHHDRLTDNSQTALRQWEALEDPWATELARIDSTRLHDHPDWLTLGFLKEVIEASRQLRARRYELWPVNQLSGWQATAAQLAAIQPVGSDAARSRSACTASPPRPEHYPHGAGDHRRCLRTRADLLRCDDRKRTQS